MITSLTKMSLTEGTVYLAARDKDLARLLVADGVPPLWERKPCFSTLIHIILEQQVSLASDSEVRGLLLTHIVECGGDVPCPGHWEYNIRMRGITL
ncbi:MAG: hypothetical protein ISS63_05195 [Desulfobacteraceae bacterium]|nr:hypothetical protein [Desulfobacteraceae bacterium]